MGHERTGLGQGQQSLPSQAPRHHREANAPEELVPKVRYARGARFEAGQRQAGQQQALAAAGKAGEELRVKGRLSRAYAFHIGARPSEQILVYGWVILGGIADRVEHGRHGLGCWGKECAQLHRRPQRRRSMRSIVIERS